MSEKIICIDAGHGGMDPGAVSGSRTESADVLNVALKLGKKLAKYSNCKVVYTRKTDIYETVYKKAADANAYKADFFISLHRNSAGSASAHGYETWICGKGGKAEKLAERINASMTAIGFTNRGTKVSKGLVVINKTNMPAVLCELGFISNTADNKLFDANISSIVNALTKDIAAVAGLTQVK